MSLFNKKSAPQPSKLKELEQEIEEAMRRTMEDGVITEEESKRINALLDKLRDMILEDELVTLDEMKVVEEIYGKAMAIMKKKPIPRKKCNVKKTK